MYFYDNRRHHLPHIHVKYNEDEAVFGIESGDLIEGSLPKSKVRMMQAWIEIHREDLMANWKLAIVGERVFQIEPLK